MDIRCRKTDCKHNDWLTCTAEKIVINEKLVCKEFKDGGNPIDISKQLFDEDTPKIKDYRHLKNFNLKCSAKCLFNKEGCCMSNGITVNDISNVAKCISYAKK